MPGGTIMKTDSQIRSEGMTALIEKLGPAEATRFMTLVQREGFDYTHWRQNKRGSNCGFAKQWEERGISFQSSTATGLNAC